MGQERKPESSSDSPNGQAKTPSRDSHGGTAVSGAGFCCPHCLNSIQIDPKATNGAPCPHCGGTIDGAEHGTTVGHVRTVGRFQRFDKVGQGGFGDVWRAWDPELERHVAIKFLHKQLTASGTARERFRREARAVSQLRHPGIAPLYEAVELEGTPALVYQFIEGLTLAEQLKIHRFDRRDAAGLVAEIAEALHYAHEMKVIHRDVKPGNIMLDEANSSSGSGVISSTSGVSTPRGRAVLVDFGLAMREEVESELTQEGQIVGTPYYMSPEQAAGKNVKEVDRRSDVYSAGVVLYELICHRRPFEGSKRIILHQVAHDEPQRPRRIDRTIDRDIENICLMAIDKDPAKRYQTARALAEDLRRYLAGEPVKARRAGWPERTWRWCRRNPAVAALTATVAVSLFGGIGAASYFAFRAVAGEKAALESAAEAEKEKNVAVEAKGLSDRRRYAAEMNNAYQSWKAGQVASLDEILDLQEQSLRGPEWNLLKRFCHLDLRTLRGHQGAVQSVAVSPDARYIASAGADGTIRIWNMATGEQLRSFPGPAGDLGGANGGRAVVAYSPDGTLLASAAEISNSGKGLAASVLKVWDTTTWREKHSLARPEAIGGIAFAPSGSTIALAAGFYEPGSFRGRGGVELWDLEGDKKLRKFAEASVPIQAVAFSPDGKFIAGAALLNVTVEVWHTASGRKIAPLTGHDAPVMHVSFSPDSRHLASASWDNTARIWDLNEPGRPVVLRGHTSPVLSTAFSPDGHWLATAGMDETVKLWDVEKAECLATWRGHTARVFGVVFSSDGWRLVSASEDGTIKVWGATADAEVAVIPILSPKEPDSGALTCVEFDPQGHSLACSYLNAVKIWNLETGEKMLCLRRHQSDIKAITYDPTGHRIASGGVDRAVKAFDVASGAEIWSRTEHNGPVTGLAYSPDGLIIASSSEDRTIRLWEAGSGNLIRMLTGHKAGVRSVVFSPDGKNLFSTAGDDGTGEVKRWNVSTGDSEQIRDRESIAGPLAISPDGRWMAWASGNGKIRITALSVPGEFRDFRGHAKSVTGLAFTPDSERLISAGADQTLRFWDPTTGQLVMTLAGDGMYHVAVSRDARWIAAGDQSSNIKLWDAAGPDINQRRETLALVRFLYGQRLTRDEVSARIRNDKNIGEGLRESASHFSPMYFRDLITSRADNVVRAKGNRLLLKPDIVESIRADAGLDELVKKEALRAAEQFVECRETIKQETWRILRARRPSTAERERALQLAQAGVRLVPDGGPYLSALGAAQYRNGMFAEALATLTIAERINTNVASGPEPTDLAFLAMTRYRIGQKKEAAGTLARLRSLMGRADWGRRTETRGFLEEAEAVISEK